MRLEIAQQTYAHYEVGRIRMPVSLLPERSHSSSASVSTSSWSDIEAAPASAAPRLSCNNRSSGYTCCPRPSRRSSWRCSKAC